MQETRFKGLGTWLWLAMALVILIVASLNSLWLWALVMFWIGFTAIQGMALMRQIDSDAARLTDLTARLELAQARMAELSSTDELTGLWNQRHLLERLEEHHAQARRSGAPLCLALLDLDHFGALNQRHGERTGDVLLKRFAGVAQGALRTSDLLGRVGGDEFLLVFPASLPAEAQVGLDRLRNNLHKLALKDLAADLRLRCSAGLVRVTPVESINDAVGRARQAQQRALAAGGDRTELG